jgi:hypothetical protein
MTSKDRKIQLFLQIFLLLTGIYVIGLNVWKLSSGFWEDGLFEFYNQEIPVFKVAAGAVTGLISLFTSWVLWMRVSWAYSFAMLTAGLLFAYNLLALGEVIYTNPYHAIPMVLILIVMLQSIPFLMRRTSRYV